MRIEQLMTQPVYTCNRNQTLNEAAQLMWEHDCGAIPIVDEQDRLVGMITDRDICMAAYTRGELLHDIQIGDAMARKVFSCRPNEPIESAERLMSQNKIRRIPVVDDNDRPIALLSLNDLARTARHSNGRKSKNFEHNVVQTLAAICEPNGSRTIQMGAPAAHA